MQTTSPQTRKNKPRSADDYVIESLLKGLRVLEALEGNNFEPITLKTIARRSKQNENYCFRALKTLEQFGYAKETKRGWQLGGRVTRLSSAFIERFNLQPILDSEISESPSKHLH